MITIEEGRRYLGVMPAVAEAAMGLKLVSFYLETAAPAFRARVLRVREEKGRKGSTL